MLNDYTQKNLEVAEDLLKRLDKLEKFYAKHEKYPEKGSGNLASEMFSFVKGIKTVSKPKNMDELLLSEMKRKIGGEASYLEQRLTGRPYEFDRVLELFAIPKEDVASLKPWLLENKEKTKQAIEKLYESSNIKDYELKLNADIPAVKRQAEEVAGAHIQKYHKTIGKFLQGLTNVGSFLRDINAVPTTEERSYFNNLTKTLALGIPAICFSKEDGTLGIRENELIKLYGHEGMGHALNNIITDSNEIPYLIKNRSILTTATAESVAQFYEDILLEDLKNSKETQRELDIEHKFEDIYKEFKMLEQLKQWDKKLFQYAITVMGDRTLGRSDDPKTVNKKIAILDEVGINNFYSRAVIQRNRHNIDSEGNLEAELVSELRYCAQPVQRALKEFKKRGVNYDGKGRSIIDETFLKGLWTPQGFVDNARLKAEEYTKKD